MGGGVEEPRKLGLPCSSAPHTNHFPGERPKGRSHPLPHVIPGVVGGKPGPRACWKAWSTSRRICTAIWRQWRGPKGVWAELIQREVTALQAKPAFLGVASTICPSDLCSLIPLGPLTALVTSHPRSFTILPNAPGSFLPFCQECTSSQVHV